MEQLKKIVVVEQVEEAVLEDTVVEIEVPVQHKRIGAISPVEACVIFLAGVGLMATTWGVISHFNPPPLHEQIQAQQMAQDLNQLVTNTSVYISTASSLTNTPAVSNVVKHNEPGFYASKEFQQEFEALLVKYDTEFQLQIESIQSLDIEPIQSPAGQDKSAENGTHAQQ